MPPQKFYKNKSNLLENFKHAKKNYKVYRISINIHILIYYKDKGKFTYTNNYVYINIKVALMQRNVKIFNLKNFNKIV